MRRVKHFNDPQHKANVLDVVRKYNLDRLRKWALAGDPSYGVGETNPEVIAIIPEPFLWSR